MLHAGVLKKFGLYGLVQIAAPLLPESAQTWSTLILWLALGNVIFVGLVTIAQNNLKSMVGNGSVMHMGYCFLGIGACSSLGASSAIMLMVAHGLSVSLMFLLSQYIYRRTETYEMNEMGGLAKQTPLLACFFVCFSARLPLGNLERCWSRDPGAHSVQCQSDCEVDAPKLSVAVTLTGMAPTWRPAMMTAVV